MKSDFSSNADIRLYFSNTSLINLTGMNLSSKFKIPDSVVSFELAIFFGYNEAMNGASL